MKTVWTIAGFDNSGGAGILNDCRALSVLGVMPLTINTANTSQNGTKVFGIEPVSPHWIQMQFDSLKMMGWPQAIKIGLLPTVEIMDRVFHCLKDFQGPIVFDPVMGASVGAPWMTVEQSEHLKKHWLRSITVFTPNIPEAERLLGIAIHSQEEMLAAAKTLCALGAKNVILKGGHLAGEWVGDVWTNGEQHAWLHLSRIPIENTHGTGCTYSAALAGALALGYSLRDAWVLARMVVQQGIRLAQPMQQVHYVQPKQWPSDAVDLPTLSDGSPEIQPFKSCRKSIGFYPIVDSLEWLERLIKWGVPSVQLRLKNLSIKQCQFIIRRAVEMTQDSDIQLFINDYWEIAVDCGAYGVHLGQGDVESADIAFIRNAGLRLGVSTHSYSELARAISVRPSYIALGPIFPTTSKIMPFAPQGIDTLKQWRSLVQTDLVAIGGINLNNISKVLNCPVDGVAVISAITQAEDPKHACQQFLEIIHERTISSSTAIA